MAELTSIAVYPEQKEYLETVKDRPESFQQALQKLIETHKGVQEDRYVSESRAREIATEEISERVVPEAQR